jgi:hypothetical protein
MVVLNQYILTFQIFCTIGIFKHIMVAFVGDISLDIIKLEINWNCIMDACFKPIHYIFLYSDSIFHVVHIS